MRPSPSEQEAAHGWRPVEPARRPVLFVNPASGGGKAARAGLIERARARGIQVVVLGHGASLAELVSDAVAGGADALGVAGGDGSLAVVAAVAQQHDLPFVCVPAGTRNHFALDLGIDRRDLIGSLDALVHGVERRIDVGEANGRLFLNNVSLGLYGDAVRRPGYRDAKARTLLATARDVLGPSAAIPELRVVDGEGHEHRAPAVVLVSNNPYAPALPTRPRLDGGKLGVIVLDRPATGPVPGCAWSAPRVELAIRETVHAGIDGEPLDLDPPLVIRIRPGALRVRISSRHPGVSPSGRLELVAAP